MHENDLLSFKLKLIMDCNSRCVLLTQNKVQHFNPMRILSQALNTL